MGIILLSRDGQILYKEFSRPPLDHDLESTQWKDFLAGLNGTREADFIFDRYRLYVRESAPGHLLVLMGHFASIAMVRLNCDILLPTLKHPENTRGLGRFFKRRR